MSLVLLKWNTIPTVSSGFLGLLVAILRGTYGVSGYVTILVETFQLLVVSNYLPSYTEHSSMNIYWLGHPVLRG